MKKELNKGNIKMCGIFGALLLDKEKSRDFCINIMKELTIRGTHSFGFGHYEDEKNHKIWKSHKLLAEEWFEKFSKCKSSNRFIFHNRYSTSGDWRDHNNNQPIIVREIGMIVMNGVLTMKTKEEYEKDFKVSCNSDNDAEIFLRKMEQGVDIFDFLHSNPQCSFAGLILTPKNLLGIRNNKRPLYYYEDDYGKYLISTLDIIRRSIGDWKKAKIVKPFEKVII